VRSLEGVLQQQVSIACGVVEVASRFTIIAVIGEDPSLRVKVVGPVDLRATGVQHDKSDRLLRWRALIPKASLISHRQQPSEWVVADVLLIAAEIDSLYGQICVCKVVETNHLRHESQVSRDIDVCGADVMYLSRSAAGQTHRNRLTTSLKASIRRRDVPPS
jgi:hypothetical protein